jgi:hypothetical protein
MPETSTVVAISGDRFLIDGRLTNAGQSWNGKPIEGLLFNSRMANAIIDDQNPATRGVWAYSDGEFSAERNTREFIAALADYRAHGLHAVAINLQGGSPQGYSWNQPWRTSGFEPDGAIRSDYLKRLDDVITACDRLGMVVILGLFYWKQSHVLSDEAAVKQAVTNTVDWLVERGARNVLLEIGNEVDLAFPHAIIGMSRCHELVALAQQRSEGKLATPARRLLVSTSITRALRFPDPLMQVCDFLLPHGNSVHHPDGIRLQVMRNRHAASYRGQPILYNEDDHYDFDKPDNNFVAAIGEGASWGFFDYRHVREKFEDGFQSLPVDWTISSQRKKAFFALLREITGGKPLTSS